MKYPESAKKARNYLLTQSKSTAANIAQEFTLPSLFEKITQLQKISESIAQHLDKRMKNTYQVANFIGNRLTILTSTGSYATQLRFEVPELLRKFKADKLLRQFTDIQIKVRPPTHRAPQPHHESQRKVQPLSPEVSRFMQEIAKTMDDVKLREVFMRLAKHTLGT